MLEVTCGKLSLSAPLIGWRAQAARTLNTYAREHQALRLEFCGRELSYVI